MKKFYDFLKTRLSDTLPGIEAHEIMAPSPLKGKINARNYHPEHTNYRNSAVLVPIISWKDEPEILLTLRTKTINHGGQISFPGGGKEGNETEIETALRESQEEVGLLKENVEIAGLLSPLYVKPSENLVTPVVAFLTKEQEFTPNPNEVEEIIFTSLADLAADSHLANEEWDLRGIPYKVPYWNVHRVPLWGATAMILKELIVLYHEYEMKDSF